MILAKHRLSMPVLLGVFCLLAIPGVAQAGTYNVNESDDSLSDGVCDAVCTVRDAIDASNSASQVGDVINIPADTYVLTEGRLRIFREGGDLTINGAGARNTIIDGNTDDGVLKIFKSVVTINDLTIRNGGDTLIGAGILNFGGEAVLNRVSVKNNVAGHSCEETDNSLQFYCGFGAGSGGGIFNLGSLELNESEVSNNTAEGTSTPPQNGPGINGVSFCEFLSARGGGIFNVGQLSLTNVTLSGNVAENGDCGLTLAVAGSVPGRGGGLWTPAEYIPEEVKSTFQEEVGADLLNVTIANNTAGAGGGISTKLFEFSDQTDLAFLAASSGVNPRNTIVANNAADFVVEGPFVTGDTDNCDLFDPEDVNSHGYNLESDTSCQFTGEGDQQNTDPQLGPLQNNGGPTDTQALPTGSPAVDAAGGPVASMAALVPNTACSPNIDQRGVSRPQQAGCDIGAYELQATPAAPAAGVAGATAQAKPTARSSIRGPRSCVRNSATVRVRGQNISTVTYSLNGKRIKRAKGNNTSVKISAKKLKRSGVNRVTARVTYTAATSAKAQTKRFTLTRCARKAVQPKFTG